MCPIVELVLLRRLVALVGLSSSLVCCGARSQLAESRVEPSDSALDGTGEDARSDRPTDTMIDVVADRALDAVRAADSASDAALLRDAIDDAIDGGADVIVDGSTPFELRDDVFLPADWTAEDPPRPSCSTDYARFLGGNEPRSEHVSDRGNPPSGWRLRTGPIAISAERCTHWIDAYHQRTDAVSRGLCRYEISFDHRVEASGLWNNGAFESAISGSGSAVFGVIASSSARVVGALRAGPAASSPMWATSRWQVTRAQLTAAGIGVGAVVRFGIRAGNSTNIDQARIGYFIDNTVDHFVVQRFVDPNEDGDCSDATRG
ncbi:MAG: hypothetical protein JNK05_25005 [Myxococcales bacterium]|nr:hypothetical protein [Myxococcales bacterium]